MKYIEIIFDNNATYEDALEIVELLRRTNVAYSIKETTEIKE